LVCTDGTPVECGPLFAPKEPYAYTGPVTVWKAAPPPLIMASPLTAATAYAEPAIWGPGGVARAEAAVLTVEYPTILAKMLGC